MSFYRQLHLSNLFFISYGICFGIFLMGFGWPIMTWVGFGLLALIIGVSLMQTAILFQTKIPIEVKRKTPNQFSLHDENTVFLSVANHSNKALSLRLVDELPFQLQVRDFERNLTLEVNEVWEDRYKIIPIKRGSYLFGNVNVFLSLKYGFVERRIQVDLKTEVKVYPSFLQMRNYELMVFSAERNSEGIKKVRKRGHGLEFSDIKHYSLGDDPRTINWKATSRKQELMVNNYQVEKSQQVYAVINNSRVMHMPFNNLSLLDYSVNATLSLLNIVLRNQDHAGLLTFAGKVDTFIPAQRRGQQRSILLDALYNQQETTEEADYQELYDFTKRSIKGRSLLLMFTNFMSLASLDRNLAVMKRMNRAHLLVVIFFENTELEEHVLEPVSSTMDIASKVMADKLLIDQQQIIIELRKLGIQAIKTKPEDLTTNTINKYLELKSQGFI
jgi:uncharacterized protein (DUF58 family)